ncbi:hypothetical protein SMKI_05G0510 [Saccharomyces mikatae IFO 1815]|uniref:YEL025C-like protein n=1 Tax=Saccharomyces mikatae IFO 1815 TaxID=226126 RepID=A0AA35IZ62_SACMI|nr:uncharacterized protein SMKI_05G0510 [Saccharomyces mikatae IFO 1815]CAI4038441.1 hypothetical protein SMKI_05G0510 [Saccharomyces mikatae IFO 1815]
MPRKVETGEKQVANESPLLPLCITSCKSKYEAGKLINRFYLQGNYYLCFCYGLYTGVFNKLTAKVEFALDGPFIVNYTIIPKFKSFSLTDAVSFCHLLMFNDGSIKGFEFKNNKFEIIFNSNMTPKLDTISSLASSWLNASLDGILYTCNNNILYDSSLHTFGANIYSFDFRNRSIETFYAADGQVIISFGFVSRENLTGDITYTDKSDVYLVCLLKSEYSDNLLLEEYHRVEGHENENTGFSGYRKCNLLRTSDNEFCHMKIICGDTIIVLTNTYTQIVKLEEGGLEMAAFFENKGLPREDNYRFLKDSYNIIYEKSNILLTIFDVYGNKYTAKIHTRLLKERHVQKDLQWSKKRVFRLPKHDLCDTVLQLPGERYIVLTRINGIHFISNDCQGSKVSKVKGGPVYTNKIYLASQVIRNKGTDIDSLLLGGSFNSKRGFLEKKFLVYDKDLLKPTTSIKVPLENVTDFWITDLMVGNSDDFTYESGGSIYRNRTLLTSEFYDDGILVTRTGKILKDGADDSTGEIRQIYVSQSDFNSSIMLCYPIKNSRVRISTLEPKSNSLRKLKDVFIKELDSKGSIITCCSDGIKKIHFAVYSEGRISVWDTSPNEMATSHIDHSFIAYDLLIKEYWFSKYHDDDSVYVIASSYIGCVRVYKSESNFLKVVLEIHSSNNQKLEILDTIPGLPFVFLYNEKETILLNLHNISYGNIKLDLVPRRMRIRPGKVFFSLCVLDDESRINVFDFGTMFEHEGFTKHIVSLKPRLDNYMLDLPSVPVQLYTIANNSNQAIACLVDTDTGQYELMLFDYLLMKAISAFSFSNIKYSHAIMKPLWSENDFVYSSLSPAYGNKFILCLGIDDKRTKFWLFEIKGNKIIQLYANHLDDCIYSVFFYYECDTILFSGNNGTATYKIDLLKDGSEMFEANSFPALESINRIWLPAYMNGDCLVRFETLRGLVRTHLPIRTSIEYPSDLSEDAHLRFTDFGSITQVATKKIVKGPIERDNDYFVNKKNCSVVRLSRLSRTELKYSSRSYVATVGADNTLAIYEDSDRVLVDEDGLAVPYLKIRLPDRVISLTSIPDGFHNLQICSCFDNERLEGIIPLFMLCGTNGQIYIVSEIVGELWMRKLQNHKRFRLEEERTALESETNMQNTTRDCSMSMEIGINESGFDELARNSKRRHIDHLAYNTIDFFDPVKLKR